MQSSQTPAMRESPTIRPWHETDDLCALTALLHRAYKPLADAGMRFVASHQDNSMTRERIAQGRCFVAEVDSAVAGAIVYYPPGAKSGCDWYRRPGVAVFGQFAVEPTLQRRGLGSDIVRAVEAAAIADGAAELALDTSEHAAGLLAYYHKLGFRLVAFTQWDAVNYRSVVMSKRLCR
jgi:predicted N-acetyltransferase YhbS